MNVTPTFEQFKQRILEILKNDQEFAKEINLFRYGDLGSGGDQDISGDMYPLCYVSMPTNPIISRDSIFPARDQNTLPGQKWEQEFWAIIVVYQPTPEDAQRQLDRLVHRALTVFASNIQLRDKDGNDPLCAISTVRVQRRLEVHRGDLMESMGLGIRPVNYTFSTPRDDITPQD